MSRLVPALLGLFSLAACATTEPGWSASGATPFNEAREVCSKEAGGSADVANPVFIACMERQGWRRGS